MCDDHDLSRDPVLKYILSPNSKKILESASLKINPVKPDEENPMNKQKNPQPKYVTESLFKKTMEAVDDRFNNLDAKINNVAIELVNVKMDLKDVKENMVTKKDFNALMDRMDGFLVLHRATDMEQKTQAFHIKELSEASRKHEVRISQLESHQP